MRERTSSLDNSSNSRPILKNFKEIKDSNDRNRYYDFMTKLSTITIYNIFIEGAGVWTQNILLMILQQSALLQIVIENI